MHFSIVIPSRNRPKLLRRAIDSVLAQRFPQVEVIVVNDGSSGDNEQHYKDLEAELGQKVRFAHLVKTNGHGHGYTNDFGFSLADGDVIGFLDDDDEWTDPGHLARASAAFERYPDTDLYFTGQRPILDGKPLQQGLWLSGLEDKLTERDPRTGAYQVPFATLVRHPGFAHVNNTLVSRRLFKEVHGFDHDVRYEEDHDFYLRAIDRARRILYDPTVISDHYVPNPNKTVNLSTTISTHQKMLYRSYVLDKAILFGKHPEMRRYGRRSKGSTLKRIAENLSREGRHRDALYYASEALLSAFSFKWAAYWTWLGVRATIDR